MSAHKKKPEKKLTPIEKDGTLKNEDYLNTILPPLQHKESGQIWVRYASSTPATRADVINL